MESLQVTEPKYRSSFAAEFAEAVRVRSAQFFLHVKFLGYSHTMDDYEQRKLRIFNQINFFQLMAGLLLPLLGMALRNNIPAITWGLVAAPAAVSFAVLLLNRFRQHTVALYSYFILYPLCTCLVYLNGVNPGIELSFILFVILSVFFLQDTGFMLFTIGFSVVSFFILSVVLKHYTYDVEAASPTVYLLNQVVSLALIFYGLILIKSENDVYRANILSKQKHLTQKNREIEEQKEKLAELNAFKSKLFSIISHDLKSPIYALRNLFQNMHRYNVPAEEIREAVPDILKDLNYTTSLMENLLQWAKSQMQADTVRFQTLEAGGLITEVANLLRLQLEAKKLRLRLAAPAEVLVNADKDMLHLVLRNLLSNAIKFTPENGVIEIGLNDLGPFAEIYVQDSGVGISSEALEKIRQKVFYTTTGTGSETGTGLGLMLCHEFLVKNGSSLQIESTVGEGSTFSFTLSKAA